MKFRDYILKKDKQLKDFFSFSGFRASQKLKGKFGDSKARIVVLTRQKKLLNALTAVNGIELGMIEKLVRPVIWMLPTIEFTCVMRGAVLFAHGAKLCVQRN